MPRQKMFTCKHCSKQFEKPHQLGHHVFMEHRDFVAKRRAAVIASKRAQVQRVLISGENLQIKFV